MRKASHENMQEKAHIEILGLQGLRGLRVEPKGSQGMALRAPPKAILYETVTSKAAVVPTAPTLISRVHHLKYLLL